MVHRPTPTRPERPFHTSEQKRVDIIRLNKRIVELEAFDPQTIAKRFSDPGLTALQTATDETLSSVFGHGSIDYNRYKDAADLDHGPVTMQMNFSSIGSRSGGDHRDSTQEARQYVTEGTAQALSLLRQAVRSLEEEIETEVPDLLPPTKAEIAATKSNKVFVVHGHDVAAREAMARFLEKIGLEAIILHEQPDQGRTIIEKFEDYASEVAFAVVLLTPDDLAGAIDSSSPSTRARQNVIFELGYFVGKLGRGRACLLKKGKIEIPSDLYGVIYTEMDSEDGWKLKLVKELKAAKLTFDANKAWE